MSKWNDDTPWWANFMSNVVGQCIQKELIKEQTDIKAWALAAVEAALEAEKGPQKPTKQPVEGELNPPELTGSRKASVLEIASRIKLAIRRGNEWDAYTYASELTDNGEKLFLWLQLDSKERSAIKRAQEAEKQGEKHGIQD